MLIRHLRIFTRTKAALFFLACFALTIIVLVYQLELLENEEKSGRNESQSSKISWNITSSWLQRRYIHPNTPDVDKILQRMVTDRILQAMVGGVGTQIKMMFILEGGQKVIFKPMTVDRDYLANSTPYAGTDRHNGEIAAFHLNRLLGFNRGPLIVGRKVNLETEILPVADAKLKNTFLYRENKTCFYGVCFYCKPENAICADKNGVLEGAVILWIPHKLQKFRHPWARTYKQKIKAKWEIDPNYCQQVLKMPMYSEGPRLFDLIDTAVFDFIIGNADRHHYEVLDGVKNSVVLLLDNGKSFGDHTSDEMTILAPLKQCCRISQSTHFALKILKSKTLSSDMRTSLASDPTSPVLLDPHFLAMDRRLDIVLSELQMCSEKLEPNGLVLSHDDW